jgi:tetratricopeptide (TPR) repeat protein
MNAKARRRSFLLLALLVLCRSLAASPVKVSQQTLSIPTYIAGEPDPNPMFDFGRNSQGAQGRVYPYPLYDSLTDIKSNKTYRIVYLENEYVRIGVLPEIGGRLFEAIDKGNGYNFIYRQHVIKPALIGLIGAWISGGIEWNIPHHHRATTFLPVQYRITESDDGGKTVWVGELELRHRMRWAVGYTLHPGRSYLECSVRILNRTPVANSMLCFANVAVHANEQYQVIYPPGTRFVTFHGKRDFTTWPLATTKYAGADFTAGVDVGWYSNHVAATSMFAWNYEDDFFGGYDHGRQAGIISFADHHLVPGKKFWTWGNGPRGRMWDRILTDDDGPYIELMVGAYSDNQPDYSWMQPYETRAFEMYWYPFRDIGGLKKANLQAAVNLELRTNAAVRVGFCTTAAYRAAKAQLKAGQIMLHEETIDISPAKPFMHEIKAPPGTREQDLRASLVVDGQELIAYSPIPPVEMKMPEAVKAPPSPKEMKTVEELYLAGLRIEQFHSPNLQPEPYWEEALARDPGNAQVNTALGIRELKQARFVEAEQHLHKAVDRLTANYTSPKDAEAFYYLGVCLQSRSWESTAERLPAPSTSDSVAKPKLKKLPAGCRDDLLDGATDALYKAAWSQAWRAPAYFALAQISTRRGNLAAALVEADHSLDANALNVRALALKAAILRHSGRDKDAVRVLETAERETDPLDVTLMAERWLGGQYKAEAELRATLRQHPATGLETAAEYFDAGLWPDSKAVLNLMKITQTNQLAPLVLYYLAEFTEQTGNIGAAAEYRSRAQRMPPDYAFPFQWQMAPVLRRATERDPRDSRAPFYLGNFLFDGQPLEAVKLWERSAALDSSFPVVHRNLALAYAHQKPQRDLPRAIAEMEQAVWAPTKYTAHFAELDALYAAGGTPPEKRLALLEQNHAIVAKRDDALSREIGLKVFAGKYDEAIALMTGRKFSVWEGGSLDVAQHWVNAHLLRGERALAAGKASAAAADFQSAAKVPSNLPAEREIKHEAELAYWRGLAADALGQSAKAREWWESAAAFTRPDGQTHGGLSEKDVQAWFGALAQQKLGLKTEGEAAFHDLLERANQALRAGQSEADKAQSQSGPEPRRALAHYLAGLACKGLGDSTQARAEFEAALKDQPDLLGPKAELASLR